MGSSVLFLGKAGDPGSLAAAEACRALFPATKAFFGEWGQPLPAEANGWEGDYIISYLSRWIVPLPLLARASRAAINFHPGPPEYPGIGCNNFALYDGARTYGSTCHHMSAKVDTGNIIAVERFAIEEKDSVASLLQKTYAAQSQLFLRILNGLAQGKGLPSSAESWSEKVGTRKKLDELSLITPQMSPEEIQRRIRATSFGPWQPYLLLHGWRFKLEASAEPR